MKTDAIEIESQICNETLIFCYLLCVRLRTTPTDVLLPNLRKQDLVYYFVDFLQFAFVNLLT